MVFDYFKSPRRALAIVTALGGILPASASAQDSAPQAPSRGDTLVLAVADVRRLTLTRNPQFLAERQETAIARGGLRQARALRFNPDLTAAAPGSGSSGERNPLEASLMQELELAGQRGLRIGAARIGVERAEATVQNAARLSVSEATFAFYRALSADRRLGVTRDGLDLSTRLLEAVRTQVREGEISALEGTLAEIEFGRARARVFEAERLATANTLELKRVTGLAPDLPVRLVDPTAPDLLPMAAMHGDSLRAPLLTAGADSSARVSLFRNGALPDPALLEVDSLMQLALSRRPDLAAMTASVREFEALTSLARREGLPNLRLGALAERVPGESGFRIGPAIGITLPIWNRNQGVVEERRAQVVQAQLQRRAVELRVRTDIETAVRSYRSAVQEAITFETTVRQPAHINSALLETAFRAGKIALPTLLLLRNQLLDAELGYWDAWLARQDALVRLQAATGLLAFETLSTTESSSTFSGTTP